MKDIRNDYQEKSLQKGKNFHRKKPYGYRGIKKIGNSGLHDKPETEK
ncbi:hypothetical protein [Methanosarcina sp. 2.H.A.1B.4]|nr:hypothetical protein [Methanosarcina sp. 2.H.A.1B.4]